MFLLSYLFYPPPFTKVECSPLKDICPLKGVMVNCSDEDCLFAYLNNAQDSSVPESNSSVLTNTVVGPESVGTHMEDVLIE